MAFSILFKLLSKAPKDVQEWYVPDTKNGPIQESEAELLAEIFEKIIAESNDPEKIDEADKQNRNLVKKIEADKITFSKEDLFHTTNLATVSEIVDRGILAKEATSLTQDGSSEDTYAVSFHTFKNGVASFQELIQSLRSGPETTKVISQQIHLAFLNPLSCIPEEFVLYPPDSFWGNRERRNKIAGRYIAGYDGEESLYPNKAPAYALIGIPSTAISFAVIDEGLKNGYKSIAKNFPFYIPAYSYEGILLYSPEDFEAARITQ